MSNEPEALVAARRRLRETADSIIKLLCDDLLTYPDRELQRRFVEAETGDQLTDTQVAELRKTAKELGKSFTEELAGELAHDVPWLALAQGEAALPDDRKNLRSVLAVWRDVAAIDAQVESLAAMFRLPADNRVPTGYVPPARFIGHLHLPTLVEHYFKTIVELRKLTNELASQTGEARKKSRAERWSAAGEIK
jgi:hypothetical protein